MTSADVETEKPSHQASRWNSCRRVSAVIGLSAAIAMGPLAVACGSNGTKAPTTTTITSTTTAATTTSAAAAGGSHHAHGSGGAPAAPPPANAGPSTVTATQTQIDTQAAIQTSTQTQIDTQTVVQTSTQTQIDTQTAIQTPTQTATQTVTVTASQPPNQPGNLFPRNLLP